MSSNTPIKLIYNFAEAEWKQLVITDENYTVPSTTESFPVCEYKPIPDANLSDEQTCITALGAVMHICAFVTKACKVPRVRAVLTLTDITLDKQPYPSMDYCDQLRSSNRLLFATTNTISGLPTNTKFTTLVIWPRHGHFIVQSTIKP